jgi:hypothetical protein
VGAVSRSILLAVTATILDLLRMAYRDHYDRAQGQQRAGAARQACGAGEIDDLCSLLHLPAPRGPPARQKEGPRQAAAQSNREETPQVGCQGGTPMSTVPIKP